MMELLSVRLERQRKQPEFTFMVSDVVSSTGHPKIITDSENSQKQRSSHRNPCKNSPILSSELVHLREKCTMSVT